MKLHYFITALLCLIIISCRKQGITTQKTDSLETVRKYLSETMLPNDLAWLNFSDASTWKVDSIHLYTIRIPFKNKSKETDFVMVKMNSEGNVAEGKIIHLEGNIYLGKESVSKTVGFNGNLLISSLNRSTLDNRQLLNGYRINNDSNLRVSSTPYPSPEVKVLPEVIVTSSYSSGGVSYLTWYSIMDIFYSGGGGGGGGNSSFYGSSGGTSSGGGGGTTGTSDNGGTYGGDGRTTKDESYQRDLPEDEVILVDFENQVDHPAIDIKKITDCFYAIPDAGAVASIEIYTDIPVNGDPSKFFNWDTNSPGHAFINLRKENGSQIISQNIGFYPVSGFKQMLRPEPTAGKFVDNADHEFNASYKVALTPEQLKAAINQILLLSTVQYDIDEYNCTDWSLAIFNTAVPLDKRLTIQKYRIPSGATPLGTNTPQGLFRKIKELSALGVPGTSVPLVGWGGKSIGPCL